MWSIAGLQEDDKALLATLKGGAKAVTIAPENTAGAKKTGKIMSMSASLGTKPKAFGKTGSAKKSTKSKKKKKKTKNYDDEGVGLP